MPIEQYGEPDGPDNGHQGYREGNKYGPESMKNQIKNQEESDAHGREKPVKIKPGLFHHLRQGYQ